MANDLVNEKCTDTTEQEHQKFSCYLKPTINNISIDGCPLPHPNFHCDLGLQLSSDMSWSKHYEPITAKAYKYLGMLGRVFNNCYSMMIRVRKLLYLMPVQSQLTYCTQLWNP